ncbi:MAG TPA: CapA family protein [Noviherbaspirillum sp.]|uniref:CapA family protein n=1 Tax=Noviherbaspirillum sp. TaxID=1926288 RepID=UPI002B45BE74|nr:CapA family protein [Noviherbaspirillum sp.]HJV88557.1 CapA family protein [Noviherbaspirillum sp.]
MTESMQAPVRRVMFGGDVMLGRLVKEAIARFGPDYPMGPVSELMRAADLTVVNLECAITSSNEQWRGEPKAFYFGAPPQAIDALLHAGVDLVSLANNHILDFDFRGLCDTLHYLRNGGIRFAGAGENVREAAAPVIVECGDIRFGMAAFCDHQQDFAAQADQPGIAYLDFSDENAVLAALHDALEALRHAGVDWPILSLHWGPNMVHRPSQRFRALAHAAIESGWKILFGHSAHVFHGIEIYRGCPIIYAAGDLVDDYYVDENFRNDHQLLLELELTRDAWRRIILHPVFIEDCQVRPARGAHFEYIASRMTDLCEEMGTRVRREDARIWIERNGG